MTFSNPSWWNSNYKYRRKISISSEGETIPAGSPVSIGIKGASLIGLGKARSDLADIVPMYNSGTDVSPTWIVLNRLLSYDAVADVVSITFYTGAQFTGVASNKYFIYMGAPSASSPPSPTGPAANPFPITATANDFSISYTRPEEEWKNGASNVQGARAAFSFKGSNFRLKVNKTPDGGIVRVTDDIGATPNIFLYDTYSNVSTTAYIYNVTSVADPNLIHTIRLYVTGDKAPSSTNTFVRIAGVEYSKYVKPTLEVEETYSTLSNVFSIFVSA